MERNSYGILKLTYLFSGAHLKIAGMNLQTHSNESGNENMKKKVKQNYEQMARQTGLRLDEAGGALYGKRGEYSVLVYPAKFIERSECTDGIPSAARLSKLLSDLRQGCQDRATLRVGKLRIDVPGMLRAAAAE